MNPIRKLLGQTAIYGLSSIIGRLLNYLLVPLHTLVLEPKDYGIISDLYSMVAFLLVFLTFGMETSFFAFLNRKEDKVAVFRNSFMTVILVNVFFFLVIIFFLQDIASALLYEDHPEYLVLLLLIVCIDSITSLPLAKLRAEERPTWFATVQFSSIIVNIVLNLVFLLLFFDRERPHEGILFILIGNLIASLVKPLLLYKEFRNLRFRLDLELASEMLKYTFPLVIAGFAGIINETLDRILLKRLLYGHGHSLDYANTQLGIYSAVYKLAMPITMAVQAFRYAADPFFFSQAGQGDHRKLYGRVMNLFVGGVSLIFLLVMMNIEIFKHFIQREDYYVGLEVVPVLLLANIFLGIYYNQSIWYKLTGKTRFGAYISIGGASITILINFLFIPTYGYLACAWATFIVYATQMIASYFLGQRYYPIRYNLRKFFLYIGLAVLLYFISGLFDSLSFWPQILLKNLLVLPFGALIWIFEKDNLRRPGAANGV